jgi:hypothetical protein
MKTSHVFIEEVLTQDRGPYVIDHDLVSTLRDMPPPKLQAMLHVALLPFLNLGGGKGPFLYIVHGYNEERLRLLDGFPGESSPLQNGGSFFPFSPNKLVSAPTGRISDSIKESSFSNRKPKQIGIGSEIKSVPIISKYFKDLRRASISHLPAVV